MDIVVATSVPIKQQNAGGDQSVRPGGIRRQFLLDDSPPSGPNFVFYRSAYQPGTDAFSSPRHHHGFQQIRWTESGAVNYAPDKYIEAGDICYFPRGAYYGPQMKDTGVQWLLQFGFDGEHQYGEAWDAYRAASIEQMKANGRLEGGQYFDVDPDTGQERVRDASGVQYELQWRMATGKTFVIPPEGYETPILMHPPAFSYYQTAPGVEAKNLGRFFDHPGPNGDTRLSMMRITDDAVHTFGPERAQIAWTRDAGLRIDGEGYPELTCLYSPRDEKVDLSSVGEVEMYVIELPRLD